MTSQAMGDEQDPAAEQPDPAAGPAAGRGGARRRGRC